MAESRHLITPEWEEIRKVIKKNRGTGSYHLASYLALPTKIKAVAINGEHSITSSGDHRWKSEYVGGIWTCSLDRAYVSIIISRMNIIYYVGVSRCH